MRWLAMMVAALTIALTVACGGNDDSSDDTTPAAGGTPTTVAGTPTERLSAEESALIAEADNDPNLPGEFVDLPAIYGIPYPYGPPPPHLDGSIDYSAQGLPPAGGKHWGTGACPPDPDQAPLNCGPVPWGIYRSPWHAESLVHNMEHAGFVIWYNTSDQAVRDELEAFATRQSENGIQIVMATFPDMATETVAITVWSRRLTMAANAVDLDAMQNFIDVLNCRFDPEGFC